MASKKSPIDRKSGNLRVGNIRAGSRSAADRLERIFFDWKNPFLPAVVQNLIENFSRPNSLPVIDLQEVILVFPGEHAVMRSAELLAQTAAENKLGLIPPKIITLGGLIDLLITSDRSVAATGRPANRFERRLAWSEALRNGRSSLLPDPPPPEAIGRWLTITESFERLAETLAAEAVEIDDVIAALEQQESGSFQDGRWADLAVVFDDYNLRLQASGLYDSNARRRLALDSGNCRIDRPVILAGCSDLNRVTRNFLERLLTTDGPALTVLVHAPESLADTFDPFGGIIQDRWIDYPSPIDDDQIHSVQSSADQAAAAASLLSESGINPSNPGSLRHATITVCEEPLLPFVREALTDSKLQNYFIGGTSADSTPPFRLLDAIGRLARTGSFADLSTLARHPDILAWLEPRQPETSLPGALDILFENHLPAVIDRKFFERIIAAPPDRENRQQQLERRAAAAGLDLLHLSEPLCGTGTLAEAGVKLRSLLVEVYSAQDGSGKQSEDVIQRRVLPIVESLIGDLESADLMPPLNLPFEIAIALLLGAARNEMFQVAAPDDAVIITGWLDLAHDDSEVAVVCGFNDSAVPAPIPADPFLPATLRRTLGIEDDRRRLARDSYALASIVSSKEKVYFILGKESHDQSPLLPSRLLLRDRGAKLARRFLKVAESELPIDIQQMDVESPAARSWRPSEPQPLSQPIETMSVSGFKTYLTCPYLFYLQHVLKLEAHDDLALELNPRQFGTIVHRALAAFGADIAVRDSHSAEEITEFLAAELERIFRLDFGHASHPAVHIQFQNALSRLRAFSAMQADRRKNGWRIKDVELSFKLPLPLASSVAKTLPTEIRGPMNVSGRIDRIDQHEHSGEITLFDYKTGDAGTAPGKAHFKAGSWHDLQLPLYRAFAEIKYPDREKFHLGYISLVADETKLKFDLVEWTEDELGLAYEKAQEVAALVRSGKFWPPNPRIRLGQDNEFSKLYGLDRFSTVVAEDSSSLPSLDFDSEGAAS